MKTIYRAGRNFAGTVSISDSANPEYLRLFPDKIRAELEVYVTRLNTNRNPFTDFTYAKKYSVVVYKIDLAGDQALTRLIKEEYGKVDIPPGTGYNVNTVPGCDIYSRTGPLVPAANIYLTISGDSAETLLKNDSTASYYFRNNEFAIRYGKDSLTDIVTLPHLDFEMARPKALLLIRRSKNLYFLLLSGNSIREAIPKNLLYQLVGKI